MQTQTKQRVVLGNIDQWDGTDHWIESWEDCVHLIEWSAFDLVEKDLATRERLLNLTNSLVRQLDRRIVYQVVASNTDIRDREITPESVSQARQYKDVSEGAMREATYRAKLDAELFEVAQDAKRGMS